jgi:hypothetical protein
MTDMEALMRFVPGQIVGHTMFDDHSRWRVTMVAGPSGDYRIHVLPICLTGADRPSTRVCTSCGQEGCSIFTQLDKIILYDEKGNRYG